jgi:glycosyltransferase involved in cell wall biosynthesis
LLPGIFSPTQFTGAIPQNQLKNESLSKLKVSIITVCYNAGNTIADTIKSVIGQDYKDIEYIIIDGASTDQTLEVINSFPKDNILVVSEKDHGLYDALNKGFALATGDIIGILHSDDLYPHPHVVSDIALMFNTNKVIDAVSSSVHIFKNNQFKKPFRIYKAKSFRPWQFRLGIQPPHPGFFSRRKLVQKAGNFNTSYRISGDFDWLLRVIHVHKAKVLYTDYVSVYMRDGGVSASGIKSKTLMNNENLTIIKSHGMYTNKLMIYLKYFLKVFQLRF